MENLIQREQLRKKTSEERIQEQIDLVHKENLDINLGELLEMVSDAYRQRSVSQKKFESISNMCDEVSDSIFDLGQKIKAHREFSLVRSIPKNQQ